MNGCWLVSEFLDHNFYMDRQTVWQTNQARSRPENRRHTNGKAGYQQSVNWLADWKQSDATWSSNRKWRALKQRAKAKITRKNNVHDYKTIMKPGTRSSNSTILIMHFVATSLNLSHRPRSSLTTTCILIKQSYYEDWCKWYGIVAMSLFAREGTNVVIINGPQAIILSTSASPAGYPP